MYLSLHCHHRNDLLLKLRTNVSKYMMLNVHRNRRLITEGREPRTATSSSFHTTPELCRNDLILH